MPGPDFDEYMIFPFVDLGDDGSSDESMDSPPISSPVSSMRRTQSAADYRSMMMSSSTSSPGSNSDDEMDDVEERRLRKRRGSRGFVSLQQRRLSKLGYNVNLQLDALNLNHLQQKHSHAININNKRNNNTIIESPVSSPSTAGSDGDVSMMSPAKRMWRRALKLIRNMKDPWDKFHLEDNPTEVCIRHRYNPLRKKWTKDQVEVKMQKEPFNHGAMRSCYRLKKVGSTKHIKSATNYVAKKYMESVERDVYFEDVRLQMDAKLWGEEYNRHHPPKQVDIFQMSILEFINRSDKPLYHLEHFIEGEYIKYNSNSGFVEETVRITPQAFSHFTFERSGHKLIIVDVQGVGDLWTDPQIHTDDGDDYGSGNLGTRGMALFFHSHVCNKICHSLKLSKFDLSQNETSTISKFIKMQKNSKTMIKHHIEPVMSPSPTEKIDLTSFLERSRTTSITSRTSSGYDDEEDDIMPSPPTFMPRRQRSADMVVGSPVITTEQLRHLSAGRMRYQSESEDTDSGADTLTEEEERMQFQQMVNSRHRPSCITHEIKLRKESVVTTMGDSVLGNIHHDLAKYHELGRFAENDNEIDWEAALFHERHAADLGVMEAILTLAKLFLGMQPDVLVNCHVDQGDDSLEEGLKYMQKAANCGDRCAMLYMASAYETGNNLGKLREKSYVDAVHWYEMAYNAKESEDESGQFDGAMATPTHMMKAKMAEMYLEGGYGLDKDPSYAGELYNEAAEDAMAAMKGRLANKYYALAEEAYGQVEEEE